MKPMSATLRNLELGFAAAALAVSM
jgi:hypothetical protein